VQLSWLSVTYLITWRHQKTNTAGRHTLQIICHVTYTAVHIRSSCRQWYIYQRTNRLPVQRQRWHRPPSVSSTVSNVQHCQLMPRVQLTKHWGHCKVLARGIYSGTDTSAVGSQQRVTVVKAPSHCLIHCIQHSMTTLQTDTVKLRDISVRVHNEIDTHDRCNSLNTCENTTISFQHHDLPTGSECYCILLWPQNHNNNSPWHYFPWQFPFSMTFLWYCENSLTFPGCPVKWSPCHQKYTIFFEWIHHKMNEYNNFWYTESWADVAYMDLWIHPLHLKCTHTVCSDSQNLQLLAPLYPRTVTCSTNTVLLFIEGPLNRLLLLYYYLLSKQDEISFQ